MNQKLEMVKELRRITKHCKKNKELRTYLNEYAEKLDKEKGRNIDSAYLVINEYHRIKDKYD